jgi:putative ABC transport system permease protein
VLSVALRGLGGRKLRSALTAIAIVLGVAMVSGTYVLTDTIDKAFGAIFQETYANTDAVVAGEGADISFEGLTAEAPPVDAAVLEEVRALPSVERAVGTVYNQFDAKILDRDGKPIGGNGAPTMGFGVDTSAEAAQFNPLKLVDGRWAQTDDEVVLDVASAEKAGFDVGDEVRVSTLTPARPFEVVGLA